MAKLEIYLLGRVEILWQGESIIDKLSHKLIGILSYMAVNRENSFSRNKIANIFWDSSDSNSSRYNLRYNIWSLRKLFKDNNIKQDIFIADKESIRFNEEFNIYVDAEDFQNRLDNFRADSIDNLEHIRNLYKGEFLEGFYIKDSSQFNDWLFYERERFQRDYINVLAKLQEYYKSTERYQKAIEILENMININPLKEELYLELIKTYIQLDNRDLALHHYNRCCTVLREELNVSPMEEIKNIYKKIKKGEIKPKKEKKVSNIRKKESKLNLYYTDKSGLEDLLNRINESKDKEVIYTSTYPVGNIEYYWISEIIDKIIEKHKEESLKEFRRNYWNDLSMINSMAMEYSDNILLNISNEIINNKVFKALEILMKEIFNNKKVLIIINHFNGIDKKSLEFIKYILYRENIKNISIILIDKDKDHENMKEIRKYFKIEYFIK
ncbi:hypothetical protein GOQ29_12400 [Clostridium sp. D2Q-14]|uniref:AfsR/SARP family transcriptional regulator n=1 Tax=Anaeromonas gelatinilytica TaxID=2683194 RepID=UPI00193BDE4F|nr:BTAD domain-containing putative transcriptional regulator [Anaeromonas gelatinilytica]MBS4536419.1 hypothetical protein [Anaeromonas gelatinilytica]